jgi:hypothetical protein
VLRKVRVDGEKGERDESFRGVLLVSGGDSELKDGFEDVAANRAMMIQRDLSFALS